MEILKKTVKKTFNSEQKRKRRSKNEVEGRSFVCECGKSYLSQPALTNHKKTKHEADKNTEKRGRGRPKKNVNSRFNLNKILFSNILIYSQTFPNDFPHFSKN